MPTLDDVRRIAAGLPGNEERETTGGAAWFVRGKLYAWECHPWPSIPDDMRAIITRGLTQTRGSYRLVLQLFNMPPEDYKAFLNFLRKHQCHVPFFQFRCLPPPPARGEATAAGAQARLG